MFRIAVSGRIESRNLCVDARATRVTRERPFVGLSPGQGLDEGGLSRLNWVRKYVYEFRYTDNDNGRGA